MAVQSKSTRMALRDQANAHMFAVNPCLAVKAFDQFRKCPSGDSPRHLVSD